jgi:HSP20 family molecular chaperone IbpA
MSTVFVTRLHSREEADDSLWRDVDDLEKTIRQRAQQLFEARGSVPGDADEDWVRAEREVCWVPQAELKESDRAFRAVIGIPGLDTGDIEVTLLPEMMIVRGKGLQDFDGACRVHFSEFGSRTLFRKIPIPALVHVDSAVVAFEKNLLEICAAKLESNEEAADGSAAFN